VRTKKILISNIVMAMTFGGCVKTSPALNTIKVKNR
jgi:hypothetical protein